MTETSLILPGSGDPGPASRPLIRTPVDLRGPAGRLEALYAQGDPEAQYAVVISHPHPLYGGTLHNKVVYHAAKAFQHYGLPVLRYNFRGAGASEGTHDRGEGEQQDLQAAMRWLTKETGLPILAAGFSFGAYVTLRACCTEQSMETLPAAGAESVFDHVRGIIALGLPIQAGDRGYRYDFLAGCRLPLLLVSGDADAFGPSALVEQASQLAASPAKLVFVAGADHFFQGAQGALSQMQGAIRTWLADRFGLHVPSALQHRLESNIGKEDGHASASLVGDKL